jgi:hypothetical protein
MYGFFDFGVTEPPQSPVGVAGCARIIIENRLRIGDLSGKIGYVVELAGD